MRETKPNIMHSGCHNNPVGNRATLSKANTGFELGSLMSQMGEAILLPPAPVSSPRPPDLIFYFYDLSNLCFLISLHRLKIIRELSCYLWKPKTYSLLKKILAKI